MKEYLSELSRSEKERLMRDYLAACGITETKWVRIDDVIALFFCKG